MKAQGSLFGFLMLLFLGAGLICVQGQDPNAGNPADDFDKKLAALIGDDGPATVVLVGLQGRIAFEKAYGQIDRDKNVPATVQTKFRIGGITKQFTAAALFLLKERHELTLDEALNKYSKSTDSTHLLDVLKRADTLTNGKLSDDANADFSKLGQVVEKVSSVPIGDFFHNHFFGSFQMDNTGDWDDDSPPTGSAKGYAWHEGKVKPSRWTDVASSSGYGNAYSTAEDLWRWTEGMANGHILTEAAYQNYLSLGPFTEKTIGDQRVLEQIVNEDGISAAVLWFPTKRMTVVVLTNAGPAPDQKDAEGLSNLVCAVDWKLEWIPLPAAFNLTPTPGPTPKPGFSFAAPNPVPSPGATSSPGQQVAVPDEVLSEYVGHFHFGPGDDAIVTKQAGFLYMSQNNAPAEVMFAESNTKFICTVSQEEAEFKRDPMSGQINQLILHRKGMKIFGNRVK